MDIIWKKNEAEINETAAKGLLVVFAVVLLISILCFIGIFDIFPDMAICLLAVSFFTLVLPATLILKFHLYHNAMKYIVVAATAVMAGAAYVLFTFQAVIIFVIPTIIAGFYLNKRLLCFSGIVTMLSIVLSHIITGFYMRQPWLEPFFSMEEILRYGALPRCLQYAACFLLLLFFVDRYMKIMLRILPEQEYSIPNNSLDNEREKQELKEILKQLSERETQVFLLMVGGYTNLQIADKLCLSNGTVKNYISTIYEKIGTKERNALIMKYSRFVQENDQSHILL